MRSFLLPNDATHYVILLSKLSNQDVILLPNEVIHDITLFIINTSIYYQVKLPITLFYYQIMSLMV